MQSNNMSNANGWDAASKYSGAVMALIYVALGVLMLTNQDRFLGTLIASYTLPFGILLIAYGIFRGYNVYHRYFKKKGSQGYPD